jgi:hypothetical protein
MLAVAVLALAQADPEHEHQSHENSARVAQVVALDECDPATFNAALPHTFTEVENFGGGFIPPLNDGEETVRECAGGFSRVALAKTRLLQGSSLQITGLSKGTHNFQCCIHPWMRMSVEVK